MQQQTPNNSTASQDRVVDDYRAPPAQTYSAPPRNDDSGGGIFSALFGSPKKPEPVSPPAPTPMPQPKPSGQRWNDPPPSIRIDDTQITEREKQQVALIKSVLDSYFNIVKKTLQDYTVKCVMLTLVNHIKENLQRELVAALYKEDLYADLLYENEDISVKRKVAREELDALQKVRVLPTFDCSLAHFLFDPGEERYQAFRDITRLVHWIECDVVNSGEFRSTDSARVPLLLLILRRIII